MGHAGRVYFDDVSARLVPGGAALREQKLGAYRVSATRGGVLQIETPGGRSLLDFHMRLESEKEGGIPQSLARDITANPEGGRLVFKGKLINPADFREIGFEQRVIQSEGEMLVVYAFRGADLRLVDRILLVCTLPGVDGVHGVPAGQEVVKNRVSFGSGSGEVVVEYPDPPPRVRAEAGRRETRLFQAFPVDPSVASAEFGLKIRGASLIADEDPLQAAAEERDKGDCSEALGILRSAAAKFREPERREAAEREIRKLEERERAEWADVQERAFFAWVSRRVDLAVRAQDVLDLYRKRWAGDPYAAKADAIREEIRETSGEAAADGDPERPRRILDRARQYAESGKKSLALAVLETLLSRYSSSDVSAKAQELMKTLSGP